MLLNILIDKLVQQWVKAVFAISQSSRWCGTCLQQIKTRWLGGRM